MGSDTSERRLRRSWCACRAAAALAVACTAALAHADVIAIGDDGSVTTTTRPALYLSADLKPQPIQREAVASVAIATVTPSDIQAAIGAASARHDLDPALASAVAWRESRFHASAVSPKGAQGVMQLMPATARMLAVNPGDAASNIEGGVTYLSMMMRRYGGDIVKALAAYNAGPGAVDRYNGVPPYRETIAYVSAILDRLSVTALAAP